MGVCMHYMFRVVESNLLLLNILMSSSVIFSYWKNTKRDFRMDFYETIMMVRFQLNSIMALGIATFL